MTRCGVRAFPTEFMATDERKGMLLRDYFAAQAMAWCLSEYGGNAEDQKQFAEAAYQIADAMILERDK